MTRPLALPVLAENIPDDLKRLHRWVNWSHDWVEGKWAKVPKQPDGRNASSTNPKTWSSFNDVHGAYLLGDFDGVGIVLDGSDGLVGVDLDDCLSGCDLNALAIDVMARLGTYTEVSPSGTGIKIFARGQVARAHKRAELEIYPAGRYFTVTGHALTDCRSTAGDQTEQLTTLIAEQFGQRNARTDIPIDGMEDDAADFVRYDAVKQPARGWDLERVTQELLQPEVLDPDSGYDEWVSIGMALHHQGDGGVDWLEAWDDWSRGSGKHVEGYCEEKWASFGGRAGGITLASLLAKTREVRAARAAVFDPPPAPTSAAAAPELTDQEKHDFVFQKKLQEVVAIDKASYLEGAFAQDVRDYDWSPGERDQITKAMRTQYKALTGTLVTPRVADGWTRPTPKTGGWPNVDADGKPACTHANLGRLLEMLGGSARYNQMTKEDEVTLPELDSVNDNAEGAKLMYIYSAAKENGLPMTAADVAGFINVLATRSSYNPALEWVESKAWDGIDRIPEWCATVVSPNPYIKEMIMRRWALQAIAVLFNTGDFQARGVLTFSGVQYAGKSRWLRSLAPPGMVRTGLLLDVHDKDSVKKAIGAWFCELGELDGTMRRSDLAALKAFISLEMDTFRRVYGRTESSYPRRTCFGASVNEAQFLQDATGNTRFWGVEVESINPDHKVDMQQLWAQVLVLYQAGEQHWMTQEEMALLNTSNKDFTVDDPLEDRIRTRLVLDGDRSTWKYTTLEALATFLQLPRTFKRGEFSALGRAVREVTGLKGVRKHAGRLVLLPPLDPLTQDFPDR